MIIVDDESDIFKLYEVYLKREVEESKVKLHFYEDGNELINDLTDNKYNLNNSLVLSDINMPAINGFELLEKIKEKFDLPIYMVTAYNRDDYKERAISLGAIDLIAKPINFKDLLKLIKEKYLK